MAPPHWAPGPPHLADHTWIDTALRGTPIQADVLDSGRFGFEMDLAIFVQGPDWKEGCGNSTDQPDCAICQHESQQLLATQCSQECLSRRRTWSWATKRCHKVWAGGGVRLFGAISGCRLMHKRSCGHEQDCLQCRIC